MKSNNKLTYQYNKSYLTLFRFFKNDIENKDDPSYNDSKSIKKNNSRTMINFDIFGNEDKEIFSDIEYNKKQRSERSAFSTKVLNVKIDKKENRQNYRKFSAASFDKHLSDNSVGKAKSDKEGRGRERETEDKNNHSNPSVESPESNTEKIKIINETEDDEDSENNNRYWIIFNT